jgi:hypothetical protein
MSAFHDLLEESLEHTVAGIASITAVPARTRLIHWFEHVDKKYIRPVICKQFVVDHNKT